MLREQLLKARDFSVRSGPPTRSRLAVPGVFNRDTEYIVRIIATSPICGWTGPARWRQNTIDNVIFQEEQRNLFLITHRACRGLYGDVVKLDTWAYRDNGLYDVNAGRDRLEY